MQKFDLEKVFVGLDQLYNLPFTVKDYPRYNIAKVGNGYKLEMALPGWASSQISVTLKDGVLTVAGEKQETVESQNLEWIHKGISGKSFEKAFKVNSNLEVKKATFGNGMLNVSMEYTPETSAVTIPIEAA